jgi:hypothetical protein
MKNIIFWDLQVRYLENINIRKNMPKGGTGVNLLISRRK